MSKRKWIDGGPMYEDEEGNTRIDLRALGPTYVRAFRALRAKKMDEEPAARRRDSVTREEEA